MCEREHVCMYIKVQAWRGQNNQPVSALYSREYYITVTTKAVKGYGAIKHHVILQWDDR